MWPVDPQLASLGTFTRDASGDYGVAQVPPEMRGKLAQRCREAFHAGLTLGWCPIPTVKAIFFDMDATVIAEESLVELAAYAGQSEAVGRITERAMAGEIDFKEALRERVGLIRGLTLATLEQVLRRLTLNPGIEQCVATCKKRGIPTYLVSGGFTQFTEHMTNKVGFTGTQANTLEIVDGALTGRLLGDIVDAQGKKTFLIDTCTKLGIKPGEVAAVGDGANDIPMLHAAGVAVGYQPKSVLLEHIHAMNKHGDHRFLEVLLLG
jgi:phosphoserine phosphatase